MSTWTVAGIPRVAFVLASVGILVAGTLGMAVPASGASPAPRGSILAPIGHITPTVLGPGAPTTNRPSFAQPFHALDPGALRSAKLRAAAIASRGSRGPSIAPRTPLAGLFNNLNRPGLSQPTVAPPDSTGAIGPNNYIEMVNQKIGVYDRNLNLISSTDNGTFTGAGATLSVSDPQIQWDGQGGRWLYAALGVATGANELIFGWSKTSDPSDLTNGWCRFGIADGNLLDDYPKLGHDDNFISIGANVYDDSTNFTFLTANIFVIRKPPAGDTSCSIDTVLYVADAAHPLHNADGSMAFTPVPANTADSSAFGYIVAAHSPVDGTGTSAPKIMVWHWAMVAGSPALVGDGDVAVSTFDIPAPVPQPGTSDTLDSLDARLTQAVAVNDPGAGGAKGIWTQHTVAGPGGRSVVRWYEILGGAPPTLRQQGDVGSPTDFVFNGAVSPSIGGGSAAVFYNRGGASTLPVIGAQTRGPSTPLGNLDAGELILGQSSAADLDFTCGYSKPTDPCRWGDYAGASPDPLHDGVVWGSSQVTGPCFIFCGFFTQWQTQNFAVDTSAISPPPPPPPTVDIPGVQGTWVGTYGVDGYVLGGWTTSGDLASLPAGVTYSVEQGSRYTWASSTTDVRALQSPDQTGRRSTTWYDTTEVRVRLNFANPYSGTLHLYAVDWNAIGRAENVTVDDGSGPRTVGLAPGFSNGAWVHVPITVASAGSVLITAHNTAGNFNAVLNGLFLGGAGTPPPPPPPPPPPTVDIPGVQGTWVGTYGVDGYVLGGWTTSGDLASLPAGVTYSVEQGSRYTWASSTTDVRALQSPDQTGRRSTTWYDTTEVRVRLNFANPYSGTLHLYAVDWNAIGRAENVTVDDGSGPRTVGLAPGFSNGAWVHVPITVASAGSVLITAHNTAGNFNAVLNGLFLGGAGTTSSISLAKSASPTTYSAVGQTITYSYTITNTGNVSLASSQFTVSDDHIGSPLGTAFTCGAPVALAPNATVGCTKTYTISQADLNAGSVTNKATASGAGLTSNQASATVTAAVTSGISLAKSASPTTYSAVGQTITYSYTITNTGNVSLASSQFTVSDDHIGSPLGTAFTCGAPVALAPNATVGCTKTYTISQADLNAGSVTNKATASGAGLTSNQASATVTAAVTSGISLAKSASPTTYSAVGQTITYSYTITNTGNVSLASSQFTVSDDHIGSPLGTAFTCGAPVALAPNATVGCTKTYTISQADLNAGSVTNKATASGAGLTSNQASATVTAAVTSGISLAKSASPTTYSAVGQTITYSYTITNTGNVSLASSQFTVSDDHIGSPLGTAFTCGAPVALAPNATVGCTKTYTISQADLNAGSVTNKATASGAGLTSNQASATVTAAVTSGISLAKSASPTTYSAVGQTITYSYTITNTGNVSLASSQFTVSDDHIGSPLGTAFTCGAPVALAPNATVGCTKTYTISQADLNAGSVTNKATASGAGLTSNQASATVTAAVTSGISLAKSASPTTYSAVGQTITYSYTITNTGNVSLASSQFTVSDDHIGSPLGTAFTCGAPVALAPNATVGCTKTYTISQADLNAGSVTNKATASGAGLTSNQASATVTAAVTPPSAPRNLTAVQASIRGVQLSWLAPSLFGGAASVTYNVYRGTSPGGESTTPIATGLTSTSYLDNSPSLVSGRKYYYKVAAVNSAGRGPYSNEASAKAR